MPERSVLLSLTCPNCYWGSPDISLEAAKIMNEDMAAARIAHPDRLRWFASLPWQYPDSALADLLGVGWPQVNESRLYRGLDVLHAQKDKLCAHLQQRRVHDAGRGDSLADL